MAKISDNVAGAGYLSDDQLEELTTMLWSAAGDTIGGEDCISPGDWGYQESEEYWRSLLGALQAHGVPRRVIVKMLMAALPGVRKWADANEWYFVDTVL